DIKLEESIEVDEARILDANDDFPYDSDEDIARNLENSQSTDGSLINTSASGVIEKLNDTAREASDKPKSFRSYTTEPSHLSRGPTSSAELAEVGVYDLEDYSDVVEDEFEIPLEFTSNIYGAM